jgi:wyosine [tRNA(Phe)-imidazoG37] synthetase (radical SAM superfamily)
MPGIILQTCLIDGQVQNVHGQPWEALIQAIAYIKPECVHLYPIDRPTPEPWVQKVPNDMILERAAEIETRTGIPVEAYA